MTNVTPWQWRRCVSETPSSAAAAKPDEIPLTIVTGTPAACSAASSSPARPNSSASPPLTRTTCWPRAAWRHISFSMNACGVERQPPRLPTRTMRACGASAAIAGSTRSSSSTTSALASTFAARSVSRSAAPGPAPSRVTLPVGSVGVVILVQFQCGARRGARRRNRKASRAGREAGRSGRRCPGGPRLARPESIVGSCCCIGLPAPTSLSTHRVSRNKRASFASRCSCPDPGRRGGARRVVRAGAPGFAALVMAVGTTPVSGQPGVGVLRPVRDRRRRTRVVLRRTTIGRRCAVARRLAVPRAPRRITRMCRQPAPRGVSRRLARRLQSVRRTSQRRFVCNTEY